MDANRTRFHLLLGPDDWGRCVEQRPGGARPLAEAWGASPPGAQPDVAWDDATQELTLRPRLFRFLAAPSDVKPGRGDRRGAAADRFGNIYWIDADRSRIRVQSVGDASTSDFWPEQATTQPVAHGDFQDSAVAPVEAQELSGLAVTTDHYLVVGTLRPAGLLIFDLFGGGGPTQMPWPKGVGFSPLDMAARPGGGVWILDRDNRCYWGLDRRFRVLTKDQPEPELEPAGQDTFQPLDEPAARGIPARRFPIGLSYDAASPVDAVDAFAIEGLPDGTVLILDRDEGARFSRVLRYRYAQRLGEPVSLAGMAVHIEEGEDVGFKLVAHDIAYLPAGSGESERLFVASAEGNQAFVFGLSLAGDGLALQPLLRYLPMRRFGGKALVVSGRSVYYDFGETWVPLTVQQRPRYTTSAQIDTRADGFDSGEPDCVWHRLMLDASIPPETSVQIWSRAANSAVELRNAVWRREPELYRRGGGPELPWLIGRSPKQRTGASQDTRATSELLFQKAQGRFLQLRIALAGNERSTPRIRALRIWYPRFSYAKNYLPAVYREDPDSGSFIERFLANVEGLYTALEDKIASVRALFHWRSAPADALAWLAGWLGVTFDPAWDEPRQRLFLEHAVSFFQYRGTIHGIRMALSLTLDANVCGCAFSPPGTVPESRQRYRIVERYRTRVTPALELGEPLEQAGPREVEVGVRWAPTEGIARLTQRYRDYLQTAGVANWDSALFTLTPPPEATGTAAHWQAFARQALGFMPSISDELRAWQAVLAGEYGTDFGKLNADYGTAYTDFAQIPLPSDLPPAGKPQQQWADFVSLRGPPGIGQERRLWQDFLARRYGRIQALNDVYRTHWTGFQLVPLFDRPPADGPALLDWYQFESVVKPMQSRAHRFSVLIPTPGPDADLTEVQTRLELARRVVELQKPAHTIFDVGFYWALFRAGEARLGLDTLLGAGSRAPELMPMLVLGRNFVGGGRLALSCVRARDQRMSLDCLPVAT